jgi:hypothetical protein
LKRKTGHFYFGENRTSVLWADTLGITGEGSNAGNKENQTRFEQHATDRTLSAHVQKFSAFPETQAMIVVHYVSITTFSAWPVIEMSSDSGGQ